MYNELDHPLHTLYAVTLPEGFGILKNKVSLTDELLSSTVITGSFSCLISMED